MKQFMLLAAGFSSLSVLACSATYDGSSNEAVTSDPLCTPAECGPAPGVPTKKCADGKVAGPECVPTGKDSCGWIITECPISVSTVHVEVPSAVICSVDDCGPEPDLLKKCPDGQIIGPICEAKASDDKCGWVIPACPVASVASSPVHEAL